MIYDCIFSNYFFSFQYSCFFYVQLVSEFLIFLLDLLKTCTFSDCYTLLTGLNEDTGSIN